MIIEVGEKSGLLSERLDTRTFAMRAAEHDSRANLPLLSSVLEFPARIISGSRLQRQSSRQRNTRSPFVGVVEWGGEGREEDVQFAKTSVES